MRLSLRQTKADAHEDSLWSAAWTQGPDLLVTGSVDETVKTWNASGETCEETHTYTGHQLGVVCVATDPQGLTASSALDSVIRVWDLATSTTKAVLEAPPAEVWAITFDPNPEGARHLAAAGGAGACANVFSLDTKEKVAVLSLPPSAHDKARQDKFVLSVAYSPDGRRLAVGAMDGTVAVFDVQESRLMHTLEGHKMPVRTLAFSPDSKQLLTGCDDSNTHLYDVEHAALVAALSGHASWVLAAAWAPSGEGFITSSSDRAVKVWEAGTRSCVQTLTQHTDSVWGLVFRPDGLRAASVSDDKSICLYDVA
jgi:WD repeat-containing protein 61